MFIKIIVFLSIYWNVISLIKNELTLIKYEIIYHEKLILYL